MTDAPQSRPQPLATLRGYQLTPSGRATLQIDCGAEWRPQWPTPRIFLTITQRFHGGDRIHWNGERALEAFPALPPAFAPFARAHGREVPPGAPLADYGLTEAEAQGLTAPTNVDAVRPTDRP